MATAAAYPAQTASEPASQYRGQVAGDRHAALSPRSVITLAMLLGETDSHPMDKIAGKVAIITIRR
jgi:hypothetical protein